MTNFRKGAQVVQPFTEVRMLPQQKHQLCTDLLYEFGARNVTEKGPELQHSCLLPFGNHANGDRTPSARLNWEKLTYNCWVCGGGGFLWWVATMRGDMSAQEAASWVRSRSGSMNTQEVGALLAFLDQVMNAEAIPTEAAPVYDPRVLDQWAFIHPYLTEMRHIPEQNVRDLQVGYGQIRVPIGDIYVQSHRIVIPHFWQGQLLGWQSRRLSADGTAKYINTPFLPKDTTIYNYGQTPAPTVIVESPMSVIARHHQAHVEATFGGEVTQNQLDLIAQHRGRVVLWMDNDGAGWNATENIGEFLIQRTNNVWVVENDLAADPADLDDETFARLLSECCVPFSIWRRPTALRKWERQDDHQEARSGADPQ